MKKSVNGWMFPQGTRLADAAKAARDAGFEAIEPTADAEGGLTVTSNEATCRRLGDEIREAGLEVASLACNLFWSANYGSPDVVQRTKARDLTIACLDRARWLGTDALLVVPAVVGHFRQPEQFVCGYADALKYTCDALKELALEAESRGVVIAVENVWNQFLLSPVEMRELIDHVNSPWVSVYLDVGNILKFGYPQDWIETLGKRISRVHVKDFKLEVGTLEGFCPLGDGDVDWPAVMTALRRIGYDGPLTYETCGKEENLADVSKRLDRILASV